MPLTKRRKSRKGTRIKKGGQYDWKKRTKKKRKRRRKRTKKKRR